MEKSESSSVVATKKAQPLKIPYALAPSGKIVDPEDARKEDGPFLCPACRGRVLLRRGPVRRAHFAHPGQTRCSPETALHAAAKRRVAQAVAAWLDGTGPRPRIERECPICFAPYEQAVPDSVRGVRVEQALPSGYVADVALLGGDPRHVRAAVEIRACHAVETTKKRNIGVPYLELDAEEVLREPTLWRPLSHNLDRRPCRACRTALKRFR
ncbi:MAG TPA: hypothetical protein ENJ62_05935, partial [Bryobacterales bacterium]|nr:hypothetical protein [Bryobacterales bacterium]